MINPELHKQPVVLDRDQHRNLRWRTDTDIFAAAASLNAFFVTAAEFADTCREYPILFLTAGQDPAGKAQVAPVAVFGVSQKENLFYKPGGWDGHYVPATLRAYPFTMARIAEDKFAVCIDRSCPGFSETEGERLFTEAGEPTEVLKRLHAFVEQIEIEVERTRLAGVRLMELQLLQPKRFDAKLPNGEPLAMDGFLALDEERLSKLGDADLLELQRSGLMGLLHAHQISLGNMRQLLERHIARQPAA